MTGVLLTILRYLFLAILYIFIFRLARMIFLDLKREEEKSLRSLLREKPEEVFAQPDGSVEPQPGVEAALVVIRSAEPDLPTGRVLPVVGEVSIGRGSGNSIVLTDLFASLSHAVLKKSEGQFWLDDCDSKNGTFLNGVRIKKATVMAGGDIIRIGDVTLQFVRWAYEVESGV